MAKRLKTNKLETDEATGVTFDAEAYPEPIGPSLDAWGRIMARVRDAQTPRTWPTVELVIPKTSRTDVVTSRAFYLAQAVREMHDEQRADGVSRGACLCDLPWCGRAASHRWIRTAAELKAIRRKVKGAWLEGAPESTRCEVHVPDWRVDVYRSIRPASVERVA